VSPPVAVQGVVPAVGERNAFEVVLEPRGVDDGIGLGRRGRRAGIRLRTSDTAETARE